LQYVQLISQAPQTVLLVAEHALTMYWLVVHDEQARQVPPLRKCEAGQDVH